MAHPARRYFQRIAKPTCEEFLQNEFSERHFLLAAITLYHVVDYLAMDGYSGKPDRQAMTEILNETRSAVEAECDALKLLGDIADSAKHSLLATPKRGARLVQNAENVAFSFGAMGPLNSAPLNSASHLFIAQENGTDVPATAVISTALHYWQSKLGSD